MKCYKIYDWAGNKMEWVGNEYYSFQSAYDDIIGFCNEFVLNNYNFKEYSKKFDKQVEIEIGEYQVLEVEK